MIEFKITCDECGAETQEKERFLKVAQYWKSPVMDQMEPRLVDQPALARYFCSHVCCKNYMIKIESIDTIDKCMNEYELKEILKRF